MKPALNHKTAKKRLRRFFEGTAEERRHVLSFVEDITNVGNAYIFGGAVRDISLFGGSNFKGDVDIVLTTFEDHELERLIETYDAEKNKFGGYRLQIGRWKFDIWEASKTWAFKTGKVKQETHLSLLETTFFNWDAILFDVQTGSLFHNKDYFTHLANKYLELNLEDNPNTFGALIRTLRTLSLSDDIITGPKLSRFLKEKLSEASDHDVLSYEAESFTSRYISSSLLADVRAKADCWNGQDNFKWRMAQQKTLFQDMEVHL
ncbi:MAG: hypothetical protein JKX71_00725 [Amylibacter sp.]|nr:hypothetical protein [Amylibacter sp.]